MNHATKPPGAGPVIIAQLREVSDCDVIQVWQLRDGRINRLSRMLTMGLVEWIEEGKTVRLTPLARELCE